jgi:hypothetical protein
VMGNPLLVMRWGVGDGPRAAPRDGEACGGRGASAAVGRRGVAEHGARGCYTHELRMTGTYTHELRMTGTETDRAGADWWAPAIVLVGSSLNTIQIQMNSNYFRTFDILTNLKAAFPSLKNLK